MKRIFTILFVITFAFALLPNTNAEANILESNTIETAIPIKFGQENVGALQNNLGNHYYKFTLTADSNTTITMPTIEGKSWYVALMDKNQEVIEYFNTQSEKVTTKTQSINIGLSKGEYYLRIWNHTKTATENYTLKVTAKASDSYEKENNNSAKTATVIPFNKAITGTISRLYSDDQDYYKFTMPTAGSVKISLSQKPGISWRAILLDSKEKVIQLSRTDDKATAKGDWTTTVKLNKGTYYFHVSNYSESRWLPYTVKISQVTATLAAKNVVIKNNKGKADTITVKGVKAGSTIKVYNSKSKQIATVKATGTTARLTVKQLGTKAGKVYVTIQEPTKLVSSRVTVSFAKEK